MADLSKRIVEIKKDVEDNNEKIATLKAKNVELGRTIRKLEGIEKTINALFEEPKEEVVVDEVE